MENKITITISGKAGSGKSRLAYIIKQLLKTNDFEIEHHISSDYQNEFDFNSKVGYNIGNAIQSISKKTGIIIEEVQLPK